MSKPQHSTTYYRTLIHQYNILDAIPADRRTRWQQQQHASLKRSIDEAELRMALGEVTA